MESTGKLDKLIEDKVDQKIRDFANNITNQVKDFLRENKKYQYIFIDKNKQPDVILKKIRTN